MPQRPPLTAACAATLPQLPALGRVREVWRLTPAERTQHRASQGGLVRRNDRFTSEAARSIH